MPEFVSGLDSHPCFELPFGERLSAALLLTGEDYEVIIVNDGSSDHTETNLKSIASKDPRFKVVNLGT